MEELELGLLQWGRSIQQVIASQKVLKRLMETVRHDDLFSLKTRIYIPLHFDWVRGLNVTWHLVMLIEDPIKTLLKADLV